MKALILAGGTGTRLWPVSRESDPKQFHSFFGEKTLLQMTFDRLDFLDKKDIFVAVGAPHANEVKRQLPLVPKSNILIEPVCRDTGPAILYAAHKLAQKFGDDEVMSIIYADHLIKNKKVFQKKLIFAGSWASSHDTLNIVEVKARSPNPNLGYVKTGRKIFKDGHDNEVFELEKFVEKPNVETARKYIFSYKYLWNTGIYVWKLSAIKESYRKYAPEIFAKITGKNAKYSLCPKISLDYAVMEKLDPKKINIIPADFGWSDIGNWSAIFDELAKSSKGNLVVGNHVCLDTESSVIYGSKKKLIATCGIKNMIIIDTPSALLVMPKEKAPEVKKIVEKLGKKWK